MFISFDHYCNSVKIKFFHIHRCMHSYTCVFVFIICFNTIMSLCILYACTWLYNPILMVNVSQIFLKRVGVVGNNYSVSMILQSMWLCLWYDKLGTSFTTLNYDNIIVFFILPDMYMMVTFPTFKIWHSVRYNIIYENQWLLPPLLPCHMHTTSEQGAT